MGGALCKWFAGDRMLFYHGAHGLGGGGHQLLYQVVRKSGAQEWSGPVARLCQRRAAGYVLYCSSALTEMHLVVGRGIWPFRFKAKRRRERATLGFQIKKRV